MAILGIVEAPACASSAVLASRKRIFYRNDGMASAWSIRSQCRPQQGLGSCFTISRTDHVRRSQFQCSRQIIPVSSALAAAQTSVRNSERTLQLPIDYYQILGAESHYPADAIIRAYEARVSNPPTEGFSQDVLRARQEILKIACDTLADRDLREEYNDGLKEDEAGTLVVDVPWSKIPGALCLLQEVGEVEVVLQVGQALLDEHLSKPYHQDIVLVTALAYVEMSREAMAESPPAVVRSCDMLNAALRLLQDEGGSKLAPALQEQIYETLEEITPRCVLELLALPVDDEHKAQRGEGLQEVRNILWTAGEGGLMAPVGGFTREQFMKEAFSRMTAAEQVALFTETPSNIPAERLEVYSVALAHVAEGFRTNKPKLIQEASTLFLQLQQSYQLNENHLITDEQRDVILGRALSALLLGEVDNCRTLLGLDDTNSPFRCPSVVEFVLSNSDENEENDLLPGLCKLLESWLSEEVFSNFRDTTGMHVRLSEYYDHPEVLGYLEKLEKGTSPLEAAAAIVRIGAGAGAALNSVRTTFQKVFPLGKGTSSNEQKHSPKEEHVPDDTYGSPTESSSSLVGYSRENFGAENVKKSKHGLMPLQVACVGAIFGGLVIAGVRYLPMQDRFSKFWKELPVMTAAVSSAILPRGSSDNTSLKEASRMNARLAEQLIRNWQASKAEALGPSHSVTQLQEILDGQMLKSWTERALEVAKHGWYWDYKLLGLNIDSVTISEDGRRAMVEATLQEAARLFDNKNPEHNDSYKSSYTTRYEFQHGEKGWKITGGAVLRT